MVALRLAVLAQVVACGSPALPSGSIGCGPGGACPDGMTCVDQLCWSDPADAWDAAVPDAFVGVDVAVPVTEHAREAEAYDQLMPLPGTTGSAEWTVENDLADASGFSYLIALPNDGINCEDQPPTDCGAVAIYDLPQMAPGTYYLHLRSSAASYNEDSLFYGLDGYLISSFDLPDGVPWAWRRDDLHELNSELHQLYIWVREDGAAFDRFVVSQSTAQPE